MPRRPLAVTAVGGGSGLAVLLRGLRRHVVEGTLGALRAVVTVADDGGSSGRLRRDFGVPAPGDIRNCLAALADDEDLLTQLFQFRFAAGEGLSGHSFGNLFLTALTALTGDFSQAVLTAERILSVRGRILPATLGDVRLRAVGRSGRIHEGESAIGRSGERLARVDLEPADTAAFPAAVEAIAEADLVVLGPGSLYTSILPNLLIPGIREAILARRERVVLLVNLMTQPGETDGMTAVDHLDAIVAHAGGLVPAYAVVNATPLPAASLALYAESGATQVEVDVAALQQRGVRVIPVPLLAAGELVRHDPMRLAATVLELASRA